MKPYLWGPNGALYSTGGSVEFEGEAQGLIACVALIPRNSVTPRRCLLNRSTSLVISRPVIAGTTVKDALWSRHLSSMEQAAQTSASSRRKHQTGSLLCLFAEAIAATNSVLPAVSDTTTDAMVPALTVGIWTIPRDFGLVLNGIDMARHV